MFKIAVCCHVYFHRLTHWISPLVLILVVFILVPHIVLLRVTVKSYSVLGLRPAIVQGLVVHSAQPGDGGVQLTEVVMSLDSLGWVHCRVTVLHDFAFAITLAGASSPMDSRNHDNTLSKSSMQIWKHTVCVHPTNFFMKSNIQQ